MIPSEVPSQRLSYLDGLRGLACLQVMFLHIMSGFFPDFVLSPKTVHTLASRVQHSALFFIYDGYAGVYIFLFLSGYVLTRAFEKARASPVRLAEARIIRLWIPTIAFGCFALCLLLLFPSSHTTLGHLVNSGFLADLWKVDLTPANVLQDIFVNPVFIGYRNSDLGQLFPAFYANVPVSGWVLNSPVWTMSVELQGSFIVLALVLLRRHHTVLWCVANAIGLAFLPRLYICFLVGHLAAVGYLAERPVIGGRLGSLLMLLLTVGGLVTAWPDRNGPKLLLGMGMMFIGIIQCQWCRSVLGRPALVKLGAISFTIYLMHWSIIFGPASWLVLRLMPLLGLDASRIIVAAVVACGVPWLSMRFVFVDDIAIQASHRARGGPARPTDRRDGAALPVLPNYIDPAGSEAPPRSRTVLPSIPG